MAKKPTNRPATKADKIRDYLNRNPNATATQVAKVCKASKPQVYAIMAARKADIKATAEPIIEKGFVDAKPAAEPTPATTTAPTDMDAMLKERGERYGVFAEHARISQLIKQAIFINISQEKYSEMESDQIEALEMIAHKIARIINGDHNYHDNWKDIGGYAKLVSDRLEFGTTI